MKNAVLFSPAFSVEVVPRQAWLKAFFDPCGRHAVLFAVFLCVAEHEGVCTGGSLFLLWSEIVRWPGQNQAVGEKDRILRRETLEEGVIIERPEDSKAHLSVSGLEEPILRVRLLQFFAEVSVLADLVACDEGEDGDDD